MSTDPRDQQQPPVQMLRVSGCLAMSLLLFAMCLLPVVFVDLAATALENLHLDRTLAVLVLLGMIVGTFVNVPVARYPLEETVEVPVFEPVPGWGMVRQMKRMRQEMVVFVNVGGCVIPVLLAVRMMRYVVDGGARPLTVTLLGVAANVGLCYASSRIVPRMGIILPAFVPALVALAAAWLGLPGDAWEPVRAPAAFVIGISGPLVGADLLRWKDFRKLKTGFVSIGGAGTWDGIVVSGLLAALLA